MSVAWNRLDWSFMLPDGYSNDKDMLVDLYLTKNMSLDSLSRYIGVSRKSLERRLAHHGIFKGRGMGRKRCLTSPH